MPRILDFTTTETFKPLLAPARYKGAWGGRGSGKSHFFAEFMLAKHQQQKGRRSVCIREVQKSLKESAKRLLEDKIEYFGLTEADGFKVQREVIETPGGGIITFTGMQDHTADSVKSLEGFDCAWNEEAQSLSDRSLTLLRPTIRKENSELWFSWNPQRPTDAVDRLLRSDVTPTGAVVVKAGWQTTKELPAVLKQERLDCLAMQPERYAHIWEGEYAQVFEGAYFARHLVEAQQQGRIGFYARDPLLPVYGFWDIGGTSNNSDAVSIWIAQLIGGEIRVLDYYEVIGQPFDAHVAWLRAQGYENAICVLPHDGVTHDKVFAITPQGYLSKAGFRCEIVGNQGRGAATKRIDAVRAMFPAVRFNETTTKGGREALGWYHEKRDEHRSIGLGPMHDWSSHAADAFGLLAVYQASRETGDSWNKPLKRNLKGVV